MDFSRDAFSLKNVFTQRCGQRICCMYKFLLSCDIEVCLACMALSIWRRVHVFYECLPAGYFAQHFVMNLFLIDRSLVDLLSSKIARNEKDILGGSVDY